MVWASYLVFHSVFLLFFQIPGRAHWGQRFSSAQWSQRQLSAQQSPMHYVAGGKWGEGGICICIRNRLDGKQQCNSHTSPTRNNPSPAPTVKRQRTAAVSLVLQSGHLLLDLCHYPLEQNQDVRRHSVQHRKITQGSQFGSTQYSTER